MSSLTALESYRRKSRHTLIGIMSGTSLDGVDAALVDITTNSSGEIEKVEMREFEYVPYTPELKNIMISLCSVEQAKLNEWVTAHYGISHWYAHAVKLLLLRAGIASSEVDAICMHGQTIWHQPDPVLFPGPVGTIPVKATLQIGETAVVRELTGIPTVGNFRAGDMAAGGEGAPLAPFMDAIVFGSRESGRIIQNIGGIGNATVLPAGAKAEQTYAYDTGPGNMVIDTLVREETGGVMQYDEGGNIAAMGTVNEELLDHFLKQDTFFTRRPPKSTGREVYGSSYAKDFHFEGLKRGLSFVDIVATATALTARTIVDSYERFVFPDHSIQDIIVAGGGAHNRTLMTMIQKLLPESCKLSSSEQYGIPDDAREAIAFAIMGHESIMGRPSNMPSVTGASRSVILGHITL
ncbi:anhydro-N-acetylmuramic acid kinase [Paenibacillus sp. RC67]|uniref:anhydro-N-acetylmuramic acid kinase n=1 Tax=Paenibacillus sp. RC67 TaxID=3039392 RepID=UPI0024ADF50B|nr:anhydro-N-acetylmuramic acid kinase [Paenibacillus sp. RC67]